MILPEKRDSSYEIDNTQDDWLCIYISLKYYKNSQIVIFSIKISKILNFKLNQFKYLIPEKINLMQIQQTSPSTNFTADNIFVYLLEHTNKLTKNIHISNKFFKICNAILIFVSYLLMGIVYLL